MNLDTLTLEAYKKLYELDEKFIGTENYIGIAYFWHYAFRHYLRDATTEQRKKVHSKILEYNLGVSDATEMHWDIIKDIFEEQSEYLTELYS